MPTGSVTLADAVVLAVSGSLPGTEVSTSLSVTTPTGPSTSSMAAAPRSSMNVA
jgi:hypothetical protein